MGRDEAAERSDIYKHAHLSLPVSTQLTNKRKGKADLIYTFHFAIDNFALERAVHERLVGDLELCALVDDPASSDTDRVYHCYYIAESARA